MKEELPYKLSPDLFSLLTRKCFTLESLVSTLAMILLFCKKVSKIDYRVAQAFQNFNLKEVSWTLLLMASTSMFPPNIPIGAEITRLIKIPSLVSKLNNAELNLQATLLFSYPSEID